MIVISRRTVTLLNTSHLHIAASIIPCLLILSTHSPNPHVSLLYPVFSPPRPPQPPSSSPPVSTSLPPSPRCSSPPSSFSFVLLFFETNLDFYNAHVCDSSLPFTVLSSSSSLFAFFYLPLTQFFLLSFPTQCISPFLLFFSSFFFISTFTLIIFYCLFFSISSSSLFFSSLLLTPILTSF